MKRIALSAAIATVAIAAMGGLASISSAQPVGGGAHASVAAAKTKIPTTKYAFTVFYDASEYYGSVVCAGTHTVSTKYPLGKDVENCTAEPLGSMLQHMIAGSGQTEFENTGGGHVSEWESDCPCAVGSKTTDFTYRVSANLKNFHISAIY